MRCARKVYAVEEWTIIRDIQLCRKKPTATDVADKPTFDFLQVKYEIYIRINNIHNAGAGEVA